MVEQASEHRNPPSATYTLVEDRGRCTRCYLIGDDGGMTRTSKESTVEVRQLVAAPPARVYDLISDVTRMGEWSPETAACRWVGGATGPATGARFRGSNRRGPLLWTTSCTVTAADPGRRFAFSVSWAGVPIADWAYDLSADGAGCLVVESWADRRPGAMRLASVPVMGIADRAAHNRRGMVTTLAALQEAAEKV
jgi:uncharacterized protein YndB with AHSA1/START domain